MTKKGAQMVIESLSLRIFQIEETEQRLAEEKAELRARIKELELVEDPIVPSTIINVGRST